MNGLGVEMGANKRRGSDEGVRERYSEAKPSSSIHDWVLISPSNFVSSVRYYRYNCTLRLVVYVSVIYNV